MSSNYQFTREPGHKLLSLLKDKGPMTHSDIVKELKDKDCSESTINRFLNDFTEKDWIFRIEKNGNVFYKINDLSKEGKLLLSFLATWEKNEPNMKPITQKCKQNLALFYPTFSVDQILELTYIELEAELKDDAFTKDLIQRLKDSI